MQLKVSDGASCNLISVFVLPCVLGLGFVQSVPFNEERLDFAIKGLECREWWRTVQNLTVSFRSHRDHTITLRFVSLLARVKFTKRSGFLGVWSLTVFAALLKVRKKSKVYVSITIFGLLQLYSALTSGRSRNTQGRTKCSVAILM